MVLPRTPCRTVERSAKTCFDATLDMLSGRYPSGDFSAFRPKLVWNRETGILTARHGAQLLAVTSGGTIPDRGMYSVLLPEGEEKAGSRRVGELDEEMVYESRVNDIITRRYLMADPANHPRSGDCDSCSGSFCPAPLLAW